ncbi:isocitrate/isopropylmalate dehydrogenase family protein [Photorhabdus luminescens]|uniref:Molybdenum cofactor biosynthesis protein n=1 Tax=Photorhabdus luminescens subsp. mexicana TaxID=2100167 RepID=A0A4R4JNK5_PHOLU|nr:isocitrate/isopropylmalate dehydrogenase family protein [Photorhabdus luminescens]TDB56087.1 molybdenum cofactor biosynthesis protein [Photorhabdus luminescens subsp. mexicana]
MNKKILILPGDGIGQEVCDAALPVFQALNLPVTLEIGDIGWTCWEREGDPVPASTWEKIASVDAVLLGAITSKGKEEAQQALPPHLRGKTRNYVSPVIQLRQCLGLYANIRPVRYVEGDRKPFRCCVIRENTEGLYAGFDFKGIPATATTWLQHPNIDKFGPEEAAWTVRLQTRFGLERLFITAFEYAKEKNYSRVTFADKPNVMRESGHFAKGIFDTVAARYPEIKADIHNVDAVALWVVKKPHEFGVIVAENMFGDILSDLAAGVMGGLGLAPSANIGSDIAYFEPVHGSAPGMAGKNKANPAAMFYTIALLLEHLGFADAAQQINGAVDNVIREGRTVTYDLGGSATTQQMAQAIIGTLSKKYTSYSASVITVGDELLSGEYPNTNLQDISEYLTEQGYKVKQHQVCADDINQIVTAVVRRLGQDTLIVVCGGLGPTPDDKTREAIARAVGSPLEIRDNVWVEIQQQLEKLGVYCDPSNRFQAMFPSGAKVIPNVTGTAPGFSLNVDGSKIVVLPGPPSQMRLMLSEEHSIAPVVGMRERNYHWTLIGVSESKVATMVNAFFDGVECDIHYLWKAPYVVVQVITPADAPLSVQQLANFGAMFENKLVSDCQMTAMEKLSEQYRINWFTDDDELNTYLHATYAVNNPSKSLSVNITAFPSISSFLSGEEMLGQMTLTTIDDEGRQHSVDFPCNKLLLQQSIPEYAAWSVLCARASKEEM